MNKMYTIVSEDIPIGFFTYRDDAVLALKEFVDNGIIKEED